MFISAVIRDSSGSNEPPSWMSDWTRPLSIKHSAETWTAFKQEVDNRETEKECWFSTAVENMHLTHSTLIPVVCVNLLNYLLYTVMQKECTPFYNAILISHNIKTTCLILCRSPLCHKNISHPSRHGLQKTSEECGI